MYRSRLNDDLSQSQLDAARLGFIHYLRRKRFSPQFIASHADDLFATATLEYSRKLAEGVEVDHPTGFLITCAWRRTKSLLEAQSRGPHVVSTDKSEAITDETAPSPEEAVLDDDRFRKVQEAVDQLSEEERRLLALSYFEGMAVREVARRLHWHPSKAQRCHEAARRHLHELLGVDSLDELEIEIGLAAFISLVASQSAGRHLPPGIEALFEMVDRGTASAWARIQDLARRFPLGGGAEPSTTAALGGTAGRAAGVCATAAVACIAATGVVGPGIGGLIGPSERAEKPAGKRKVVRAPLLPSHETTPLGREQEQGPITQGDERQSADSATASTSERRTRRANRAVRTTLIESVARGSDEEIGSAPAEPESSETTSSATTSSTATANQVAAGQFSPSP